MEGNRADNATSAADAPISSGAEAVMVDAPESEAGRIALYDAVVDALEQQKPDVLQALLTEQHPADIADVIEQLSPERREQLIDACKAQLDPEVLAYLDETVQEEILKHLDVGDLINALPNLLSDDAVELLSNLEPQQIKQVLAQVPAQQRIMLEESLSFAENTAGRLMQREVMAVPVHWTVGQALDFARVSKDLPKALVNVVVVDSRYRPVGIVPLAQLLQNSRQMMMKDVMTDDFMSLSADMTDKEVRFLFQQYGLLSAPVVNDAGRLLGQITLDDVVYLIDEAAEQDLLKFSGIAEDDFYKPAWVTSKHRIVWLVINLATAMLASSVISAFQDSIAQMVALAVLMPIVASMGGNAGIQTLTVTVRAIATKEISLNNWARAVGKELLVALMNGAALSVIAGGLAAVLLADWRIAGILMLSMIINLAMAGLAGVMIPLLFHRLKMDPAPASGVFLTTVTDVVGFFTFLGLASWWLV